MLRQQYGISLQRLRKVGAELRKRRDEPWSALTFYVVGKDVFAQGQADQAIRRANQTGQQVMPFALERVDSDVRAAVRRLRQRPPEQIGKIARHRYVADDQPVLAGTRVPTGAVWEFHAAGYSIEDIRRQYPQLTSEDVMAALAFERQRPSAPSPWASRGCGC